MFTTAFLQMSAWVCVCVISSRITTKRMVLWSQMLHRGICCTSSMQEMMFFFTPVAFIHVCTVCTCFSNNKDMNSHKTVKWTSTYITDTLLCTTYRCNSCTAYYYMLGLVNIWIFCCITISILVLNKTFSIIEYWTK